MKAIQDSAALFFLAVVFILTIVSIMGIWNIFGDDVIVKSFQTLCLVGFVSAIVISGSRYVKQDEVSAITIPNPVFKSIRVLMLTILVMSSGLLALLGVLAIWEVLPDMDVLYRSLGSLGVIAFTTFICVVVCLDREGNKHIEQSKKFSAGSLFATILVFWFLWLIVSSF